MDLCLDHRQVGKSFGEMAKREVSKESDADIGEGKTLFDGTVIEEVAEHLLDKPA
ncbi:hypothetical protein ACQY0O_002064 [Thecaphora frezii]